MPLSITQLQEQIFQREGFRVSFERLGAGASDLPPYDYPVMAPGGWKISDWRLVRLAPYMAYFKGVTVYRGDGEPQRSDVKLAHLRDGYYKATYGTLEPETNVSPFQPSTKKKRKGGSE